MTTDVTRGKDKTPWPEQDAAGNNLRHTEDCAWRFGGKCDCPHSGPESLAEGTFESQQGVAGTSRSSQGALDGTAGSRPSASDLGPESVKPLDRAGDA